MCQRAEIACLIQLIGLFPTVNPTGFRHVPCFSPADDRLVRGGGNVRRPLFQGILRNCGHTCQVTILGVSVSRGHAHLIQLIEKIEEVIIFLRLEALLHHAPGADVECFSRPDIPVLQVNRVFPTNSRQSARGGMGWDVLRATSPGLVRAQGLGGSITGDTVRPQVVGHPGRAQLLRKCGVVAKSLLSPPIADATRPAGWRLGRGLVVRATLTPAPPTASGLRRTHRAAVTVACQGGWLG